MSERQEQAAAGLEGVGHFRDTDPDYQKRTDVLRYILASVAAASVSVSASVFGHEIKAGDLEIVHPWAAATIAHAEDCVVYMTIENHGAAADRLIGATSPLAERVEVHDTDARRKAIDLPAGAVIKLRPTGSHLMLLGLKERLVEYGSFHMTLKFERTGDVDIDVQVEAADPPEPEHQQ
jgi:periplasmic copper chaperone A